MLRERAYLTIDEFNVPLARENRARRAEGEPLKLVQNVGLLRFLKPMRKVEKSIPKNTESNCSMATSHDG